MIGLLKVVQKLSNANNSLLLQKMLNLKYLSSMNMRDHSFSMYAKVSEKLTFLTP